MLRKAAEKGDVMAMANVGGCYLLGFGVRKDKESALAWSQKAAVAGNSLAMRNLGAIYLEGIAEKPDISLAFQWYEKAAAAGEVHAMNDLGSLYATAPYAQRSLRKAKEWYQKAADLGDSTGMSNLGITYLQGDNPEQAMGWLKKAVDTGESNPGVSAAMVSIGGIYETGYGGHGVQHDYAIAMNWYRKAADRGYAEAMKRVAFLYENGMGVEKSSEQAAEWLRRAAAASKPKDADSLP